MTKEATRWVPTRYKVEHGKSKPFWESVCSPESFKVRARCLVSPQDVVLIVFVPGVMGSNLRSTSDRSVAWIPPNGTWEGGKEWWGRDDQPAAARQRQLNPNDTEVADDGKIEMPHHSDMPSMDLKEARRRGWGTLHWESYGETLIELEKTLNLPYGNGLNINLTGKLEPAPRWKAIFDPKLKHWNPKTGHAPLTLDEFKKLGRYYYPVHAVGYNWLQSCGQSAKHLKKKLREFADYYKNSDYFRFKGIILVTHSLGGPVARACTQLEGMENEILGVVHGVQPVNGAPVVYRRFRAGTEGGSVFKDGPIDAMEANMGATVIGATAADTTAVLAHAPGVLELLPTKNYSLAWLHTNCKNQQGDKNELSLQESTDPYAEIYSVRAQDAWWGMVDESLIDPAGLAKKQGFATQWEMYEKALKQAKKFHDDLKLQFHRVTYAYYGSDNDQASFANIVWKGGKAKRKVELGWLKKALTNYRLTTGEVGIFGPDKEEIKLKLDDKRDQAGDGTVPHVSASVVETCGLKQTFCMKGFNHQFSYKNEYVRQVTLYCIAKIAQLAK